MADDAGLVIGLVGPLPPPNGGMAMQTLQLARLLRAEGVHVELEPTNAPYSPAWVARTWGLRAVFRLLPYLYRIWRLAGRVPVIHVMANSGWSWQLFAAPVVWIGALRRTPIIVNYRGGEAREYLERSRRFIAPTLRRASRLVVPSGFLHDVFRDFGFCAEIVPNIIDFELFSPSDSVNEQQRGFCLVITRNLETIYGLETAIRAIKIVVTAHPDVQLKIAGSGPLEQSLKSLVSELGLEGHVTFLGRLERDQVVALYREADGMLNPSRVDNMPNSVLEALACQLAVVSTNVGGVPYIVEDGATALLVPPDDPEAMARSICSLIEEPALCQRIACAGRASVQQYSWQRVGTKWIQLYRQLAVAR